MTLVMSSADFSNFGSAALGIAGTAYVVGETTKVLRGAQKTASRSLCKHCGSHEHTTRMHHMKHKKEHGPPHRTGHTSRGDDYAFDFRI